MHEDEYEDAIDPEYEKLLGEILDHQVIDGKVYISADGLNTMLKEFTRQAAITILTGGTCQHGAKMADDIIGGISELVDACIYVRAGDVVPDTIPDDILDV